MKFRFGRRGASKSSPPVPARMSEEQYRNAYYGEHHQAERQKYVETLRDHGGQCMERRCVMPSRRIEPGSAWQLAHDHSRGPRDYLGPAHAECNEFEARMRGITWEGEHLLSLVDVDRIADRLGLLAPELPDGDYEARTGSFELKFYRYDNGLYQVFHYTITAGMHQGRSVEEWIQLGVDPCDSEGNELTDDTDFDQFDENEGYFARSITDEDQERLDYRLALFANYEAPVRISMDSDVFNETPPYEFSRVASVEPI